MHRKALAMRRELAAAEGADVETGLPDCRLLHVTRRSKTVPRGRGLFVRYLTRRGNLVLLSITVLVNTYSVANAGRCFRSLIDAHIRPAPDRR